LRFRRCIVELFFGHTVARDGIEDRELNLFVAGVEIDKQFVDLVDYFFGPRILAIDFIDHGDCGQPRLQSFAQDESRLRQASFGGVDQEHYAVNHLQNALDLAAEVGVAGRIDDIDFVIAVTHGSVFGHDRDAALTLKVH
jgi:hypothetical protein